MAIQPKLIYRFNIISFKVVTDSQKKDKLILKFIWKCKRPRRDKTMWKKKSKIGKLILSDFKTHYKPTVIKAMWYWCGADTEVTGAKFRIQQ